MGREAGGYFTRERTRHDVVQRGGPSTLLGQHNRAPSLYNSRKLEDGQLEESVAALLGLPFGFGRCLKRLYFLRAGVVCRTDCLLLAVLLCAYNATGKKAAFVLDVNCLCVRFEAGAGALSIPRESLGSSSLCFLL